MQVGHSTCHVNVAQLLNGVVSWFVVVGQQNDDLDATHRKGASENNGTQ